MPFIDGTEVDFVREGLIRYSNFTTLKPRMNVAVAKLWGIGGTMSRNTEATDDVKPGPAAH